MATFVVGNAAPGGPSLAGSPCIHCKEIVKVLAGKFSGRYYTVVLWAETGAVSSDAPPQPHPVHEECWAAFKVGQAPKCTHCGEAICHSPQRFSGRFFDVNGSKVHSECFPTFRVANAPKCAYCSQGIAPQPGLFSGSYSTVDAGAKVHIECMDAWRLRTAHDCLQCRQKIVPEAGRHTGAWYDVDDGQIHAECADQYKVSAAPACAECGKKISGTGHVEVDGHRLHADCVDAFHRAAAPLCVQCRGPICRDNAGSSQYYEVGPGDGAAAGAVAAAGNAGGKCHVRCWEQFLMAKLEREFGG